MPIWTSSGKRCWTELSQADWDAVEFSKEVAGFVDGAGKDAPAKRERMIQLMGFAGEFYRQVMRCFSGMPIEGDAVLQHAVTTAHGTWPGGAETAAACLERCLDAQTQVQANANQATLLDCWLDELATITRTASPSLCPFTVAQAASLRNFTVAQAASLWPFTVAQAASLWNFTVAQAASLWLFTVAQAASLWLFTVAQAASLWLFTVAQAASLWLFTVAQAASLWLFTVAQAASLWLFTVAQAASLWNSPKSLFNACP
jgi:hypothetical protein